MLPWVLAPEIVQVAVAPASTSVYLFNQAAAAELYTLSLHDALPISTTEPVLPPATITGESLVPVMVMVTVSVAEGPKSPVTVADKGSVNDWPSFNAWVSVSALSRL